MKKILIYRNASLGDFIVSLPALNIIKKKNPNTKLFFASLISKKKNFVRPDNIPLKKKLIDKFIFFEYGKINFYNFCKNIKKKNFSKIYYLNAYVSKKKLLRDYLIFNFLGIKKKIGFEYEKFNYEKFNETYYLCRRVKKNLKNTDLSLKGYLLLKKNIINNKYITISFGGKNPLKKWSQKNWKNLIMSITTEIPNIKIVIVGSVYEFKIAKNLAKAKPGKIINLCNRTNIADLINVIGNSSYHISHDDGTMHIASTFNKKSTSIFGKSTAEKGRWFPKNPNLKIFYNDNVNNINCEFVKAKVIKDIKKI